MQTIHNLGHVQGVWYRASAQEQAKTLGITGWAKNLSDGSVEILACGSEQQLEVLHKWLWYGPKHARVDNVVCSEVDWCEYAEFFVK